MESKSVGDLLREWRQRRRLSQLNLATQADISARHLCFVETGRSQPSKEMLLRLADYLEMPLRVRNLLLNAAGYASVFPERALSDPALAGVRQAIDVLLESHRPYPAFAIDRHWTLVASNGGFTPFLSELDPILLCPPVNVLRLTLHPGGMAPQLANYEEWRCHVFDNLERQIEVSGDPVLADLLRELRGYPAPPNRPAVAEPSINPESHRFVVPFQLATRSGILSFFTTTTVFGTPVDITLSELSLESFYPADRATAEVFQQRAYLKGN